MRLQRRSLREVFAANVTMEFDSFVDGTNVIPPQTVPIEFLTADRARKFPAFVNRGLMEFESSLRLFHFAAFIASEKRRRLRWLLSESRRRGAAASTVGCSGCCRIPTMHVDLVIASRLRRGQFFAAQMTWKRLSAMHARDVFMHRFGSFELLATFFARAAFEFVHVESMGDERFFSGEGLAAQRAQMSHAFVHGSAVREHRVLGSIHFTAILKFAREAAS